MNFLKAMCINYQRLLRRLERKLADKEKSPFCEPCFRSLNCTLEQHWRNQTLPMHVDLSMADSVA